MSLLDLTLRNVRRNFRLYTIYLFSMITGVVIHFTFSSLMFNQDILSALNNSDNFRNGVTIASIVIFLFIIFFLLYANSFFMKQRKKELGMYLLFGMSERQVTLMLFYETLSLGAISIVAGIMLGGLLSKLFGMLLMNLMQYNQVISLSFPLQAIGSTIAVFLVLAMIISIQNFILVRGVQLIELFHAKAAKEKPIRSSTILALLSIILLVQAFILVGSGSGSVVWQDYALAAMIAVTIGIIGGTYLFFHQFTGWLLQKLSRGSKYHEGNTVLWTSPLRFSIRSNTLNLTFISLFSAVIMLLTSFVAINYSVQFKAVGMNLPNDIAFHSLDRATNDQIDGLIKSSEHAIRYHQTVEGVVAKPVTAMNEAFENPEYFTPELLLVSERAYNEVVALRGDEQLVQLRGNEAVALSQGMDMATRYEAGHLPDFTVVTDTETTLSIAEKKDYALLGWASDPVTSMSIKPAVFVISDTAYQRLQGHANVQSFEIYQLQDAKNAEELSRTVHALVTATPGAYYSSFADVYSTQIESSSLLLFASAFLAIIALFALASVIYFRQLREATEAQQQYTILRKIGVNHRQMKSVIRKQLLFVFVPPLLLGLLHSWLIIDSYMLDSLQDFPELTGIVQGIMAIYFLIYCLFYLSSTNIYYKIVNQRP